MEQIRFNIKMKTTEDGYEYRGYKIRRKRNSYFGTTETVWLTEGEVFVTLRDAKEYLDRKVMNEYIKYRESVSKSKH